MKVSDCLKCGKVYKSFMRLGLHIYNNCSDAYDLNRTVALYKPKRRASVRSVRRVPSKENETNLPRTRKKLNFGVEKHYKFLSAVKCPDCPMAVETTDGLQAHLLEAHGVNLDYVSRFLLK